MEIYNEHVRDLLRDQNQPQLNLRVREHPKEGPYVQGGTSAAVCWVIRNDYHSIHLPCHMLDIQSSVGLTICVYTEISVRQL